MEARHFLLVMMMFVINYFSTNLHAGSYPDAVIQQ